MKIDDFLKLDYFIYSSHKTMTQSIKSTLSRTGFSCAHVHLLDNIQLDCRDFKEFCCEYFQRNKKKLKIISVFRDPLDRLMSSFFQSLSVEQFGRTLWGSNIVLRGLPDEQAMASSVLFSEDFVRIQQRFWYYCAARDGRDEAIDEFLKAFDLDHAQVSFTPSSLFHRNEFEYVDLYISRFDLLREAFVPSLEDLTGARVSASIQNLSTQKWYSSKYIEFRKEVRVPNAFITNMYLSRNLLGKIFYADYDDLLKVRLSQYSL